MTEPRNARTQPGGGRKYVWDGSGMTETFDSVTTILNRVLNKPAITGWATRSCGEFVADNMGRLYGVWKEDREALVEMVRQSPWKRRDGAAERGSKVHAIAEARALGQTVIVPEALAGYVHGWEEWVAAFSPTFLAAEATCYSREHGYAGTFDLICETERTGRILLDYKTAKDVYPEASLQLTAYRGAEFVGMPDGTEEPMPEVEGTYVLLLKADGEWDLVPVRSDSWQWLRWCSVLDLFRWTRETDLIGASVR